MVAAATELGIRWISYDRPGFGGSTRQPGRCIADAAHDIAAAQTLSTSNGSPPWAIPAVVRTR